MMIPILSPGGNDSRKYTVETGTFLSDGERFGALKFMLKPPAKSVSHHDILYVRSF